MTPRDLFPDAHARLESMPRVLSVVGPPGVGKSTWLRAALPDAIHVDMARADDPDEALTRLWAATQGSAPEDLEETLRARPPEVVVFDHADEALEAGMGGLVEHLCALAPGMTIVLVTRRPFPPFEQHLITLDRPDRAAAGALLAEWLPQAPSHQRGRLLDYTNGNPGALFVLSRRARLVPLEGLLDDPRAEVLGALGYALARVGEALDPTTHAMRRALSALRGPFTLDEARAVCGASFDYDALQLLSDAGWLDRPTPRTWHLAGLLRAEGAPPEDALVARSRALDAWSQGWLDGPRDGSPHDGITLTRRLDDLIDAWRHHADSDATQPLPHLYTLLAWLSSAPNSSTWSPSANAPPPEPVDVIERRARLLVTQGRVGDAATALRDALAHPTPHHDVDRATLWARLGKLLRARGDHAGAGRVYAEAAQCTLGESDWPRSVRYLWRSVESWRRARHDDRAREAITELLDLLAEQPDLASARPAELDALARRLGVPIPSEAPPPRRDAPPEWHLPYDPDGARYQRADGVVVDLSRKRVAARLLATLVDQHTRHPGHALGFRALFDLGWPGQRHITEASAMNRLRVAIARLRSGGLEPFIVTTDDGYMLAAEAMVVALE
jgi:hypothetical protein